ncbi:MAG TPA: hypothetical protein VFP31_00050 [Gaiellaceae bacterium]|nr:hypothetical protein [Gaiellaceae bacterium]
MKAVALALLLGATAFAATASPSQPAPQAQALTKRQAIAAVRTVLNAHRIDCGHRLVRISARRSGVRWRVDAVLGGALSGTARWLVARTPAPANALARTISAGCPPPAPPPLPPPLTGPGAPATFVYGAEISAVERARVERGLNAGARYYRSALGRELPPFRVWAYRDLDALVAAYAQNEPTFSLDQARRLWEGGQVAHATTRKVWFGPSYFLPGRSEAELLRIAAHEAFHLFQYELAGARALGVSGLDEIPVAGPWWISEGTAKYFADLAIVREGVLRLEDVRGEWIRRTKVNTTSLADLATLRGQRETANPYEVYTLATELLLRDRSPTLVFAYYEAIGRGVAWRDAFASTFGRSIDAFVAEFEAYRRTL